MAKKVKAIVKLNLQAGKANPAPPVGPALGQHGIPLMDFCKQYNEKTKDMGDQVVPAVVTIYEDRTFTFITKTPPVANLLLKALGKEKGSAEPNKVRIGTISKQQVREIAEKKLPDLNTTNIEAAMRIIEGTARNMGIEVSG